MALIHFLPPTFVLHTVVTETHTFSFILLVFNLDIKPQHGCFLSVHVLGFTQIARLFYKILLIILKKKAKF